MTVDTKPVHGAVSCVPSELPDSHAPNARRRRLLIGALGTLPSVYTLASGAQAAAVSGMACWMAEPGTPPARFTSGTDTWYRSKVFVGNYEGNTAYCVTSPQNACLNLLDPGKGGDGSTWVMFNRTRPTLNGPTLNAPGGLGIPPSGTEIRFVLGPANQVSNLSTIPVQGLVYVDQNATIATLDPNGRQYLHAVSGSCWTSMLGGRASPLG